VLLTDDVTRATRARIKRTWDLPAELVERMEAAKAKHAVNWAAVVREALEAECNRLEKRRPSQTR
jgi:predicted DNA-binding protein